MSFEPNDMNTIHLGNYEEFFILYMDNELSEEQVKMVDEFLSANPDLRAEFEILMSTKLPLDEFNFDKKDLLAESMKLSSVDEELLLYIDNELPTDKKNIVELEIASNKEYQLQYQALVQTKLDAYETVIYPNKKELYRRTERVIAFKPWMRVAAAVVVIAIGGMFYLRNSSHTIAKDNSQNIAAENPVQQKNLKKGEPANPVNLSPENEEKDQTAVVRHSEKEAEQNQIVKRENTENKVLQNAIASNSPANQNDPTEERVKVKSVHFDGGDNIIALNDPNISVNKNDVTSLSANRISNSSSDDPDKSIVNDRKGSLKGFLRKATRVIEKRTGFNPTNENGELLIGAVAINLK